MCVCVFGGGYIYIYSLSVCVGYIYIYIYSLSVCECVCVCVCARVCVVQVYPTLWGQNVPTTMAISKILVRVGTFFGPHEETSL